MTIGAAGKIPMLRALLVLLLIIVVETVHGILRGIYLTPVVGGFRAGQIGVCIASALILGVSWLTIRWMAQGSALTKGALIRMGVLWTVLMLVFEFSLGQAIGRPWPDMLADYDLARGGLMPFGLVVLVLAPWVAARMRGVSR
jgi:hypothetical protein